MTEALAEIRARASVLFERNPTRSHQKRRVKWVERRRGLFEETVETAKVARLPETRRADKRKGG